MHLNWKTTALLGALATAMSLGCGDGTASFADNNPNDPDPQNGELVNDPYSRVFLGSQAEVQNALMS